MRARVRSVRRHIPRDGSAQYSPPPARVSIAAEERRCGLDGRRSPAGHCTEKVPARCAPLAKDRSTRPAVVAGSWRCRSRAAQTLVSRRARQRLTSGRVRATTGHVHGNLRMRCGRLRGPAALSVLPVLPLQPLPQAQRLHPRRQPGRARRAIRLAARRGPGQDLRTALREVMEQRLLRAVRVEHAVADPQRPHRCGPGRRARRRSHRAPGSQRVDGVARRLGGRRLIPAWFRPGAAAATAARMIHVRPPHDGEPVLESAWVHH